MSPFLKIVLRPPFDGGKIHGSLFCLVSFWDTERSSWNWPEYQDAEGAGAGRGGMERRWGVRLCFGMHLSN